MKTIKRYCRLYKVLVSQFFKVILQSKVDFLIGLVGFLLTQVMGIVFLYLVFGQIPSLQGWTLDQLIFIYGFAQGRKYGPAGGFHPLWRGLYADSQSTYGKYL